MRRLLFTLIVLFATTMLLTACIYDENPVDFTLPALDSNEGIAIATSLFEQVQTIWDEDNGEFWGERLDSPLMFADAITRVAITNMSDPEGLFFHPHGDVYMGILPDNIFISNTASNFAGTIWGMMQWHDVHLIDEWHESQIVRLLVHEGFHARQYDFIKGEWMVNQRLPHMFYADARTSVALEMTALLAALRSEGDERLQHITNALSLRASRRYNDPDAARNENGQEMLEGMAWFTEHTLVAPNLNETLEMIEDWLDFAIDTAGFNMFGYFSGTLYGFLLDDTGAIWNRELIWNTDLGEFLQNAMNITELIPFEQLELEQYDYTRISAISTAWVISYNEMVQRAYEAVTNPSQRFILEGDFYFSDWVDAETFFIGEHDEILVTAGYFTITGTNYIIDFNDGHMSFLWMPIRGMYVGNAHNITVSASGTQATSPTWTLTVTDNNYHIVQSDDGLISVEQR